MESMFLVDIQCQQFRDSIIQKTNKDPMKKFCPSLRQSAKNIMDFEKKEMLQLTKKELK